MPKLFDDVLPAAESHAARQASLGLAKLAASAALVRASLSGSGEFESGMLVSPEIRITPEGDIEAWIDVDSEPVDMFKAWPNKFGMLAFGFACDHFKMLYANEWAVLSACARDSGVALRVGQREFGVDPSKGLSEAMPERMTAPALMAMCKRMAASPAWLMSALDDLEHGRMPISTPRSSKSGPGST